MKKEKILEFEQIQLTKQERIQNIWTTRRDQSPRTVLCFTEDGHKK